MGGSGWPGVFFRDIWLNCIDAPDLKEYRIDKGFWVKMVSNGGFWLERLHTMCGYLRVVLVDRWS